MKKCNFFHWISFEVLHNDMFCIEMHFWAIDVQDFHLYREEKWPEFKRKRIFSMYYDPHRITNLHRKSNIHRNKNIARYVEENANLKFCVSSD